MPSEAHPVLTLFRRLTVSGRFSFRGNRIRWPRRTKLADVLAIHDIDELWR